MNAPRVLNQEEVDKTSELFKKAETNLKSAEHLTNVVFIPALNELRYAGYHLVKYLSSTGDEDDLRSAQKHCKRAIYDTAEGPMLKFLGDVAKFQEDYSKEPCITDVIPGYVGHMKKVAEARNLIAEVKPESRDEYFDLVEPHLTSLIEIAGLLDTARPEINKRMRSEQKKAQMTVVILVVAVLTLIATVLGPIQFGSADSVAASSLIEPPASSVKSPVQK
ncbi:hypothetical protein [Rhodoferax sp.]|uniref:hypothetical protein n=1 Tax=Rhodoferax sp. TaxID=50421 RepID=UPI003BB6C329